MGESRKLAAVARVSGDEVVCKTKAFDRVRESRASDRIETAAAGERRQINLRNDFIVMWRSLRAAIM